MKLLEFSFGGIFSNRLKASCALYDGDFGLVNIFAVN